MLNKNPGLRDREKTTVLEIHRTKTGPHEHISRHDIHKQELEAGNLGIGYHFVIKLDGTIEKGRDIHKVGIGNPESISVCVVGGVNNDGQLELPFFNNQQQESVEKVKAFVKKNYNIGESKIIK